MSAAYIHCNVHKNLKEKILAEQWHLISSLVIIWNLLFWGKYEQKSFLISVEMSAAYIHCNVHKNLREKILAEQGHLISSLVKTINNKL